MWESVRPLRLLDLTGLWPIRNGASQLIACGPQQVCRAWSQDVLSLTVGDMSNVALPTKYPLIYLVFSTIYNLLTQDAQVRCFENAARHLTDDGCFVIEAGVPSAWIRGNQYVNVERVANDEVVLDVNRYDPVTRILDENHVTLSNNGVRLGPISCRLAWPSELDLMARIAGLRLVDRWAGWRHEPFTATSERHISVYAGRSAARVD